MLYLKYLQFKNVKGLIPSFPFHNGNYKEFLPNKSNVEFWSFI